MPPTLPSLLCRSGVNTAGTVTGTIEEFDREDKPRTMVGQGQVCLYLSINLLLYSLLFWFKSFRQLTVLDGSFSLNVESHNVTCFGFQFCNAQWVVTCFKSLLEKFCTDAVRRRGRIHCRVQYKRRKANQTGCLRLVWFPDDLSFISLFHSSGLTFFFNHQDSRDYQAKEEVARQQGYEPPQVRGRKILQLNIGMS